MSKEIENVEGLEEATATKTVKATTAKSKKEYTAEEIAAVKAAAALVQAMGVSENFNRVLALASAWNDKDSVAAAKEAAIAAFGSSQAFKDYIDEGFVADVEAIAGIQKLSSTLNNIKSFYARREASKKIKMVQVSVAGTLYDVNSEFLSSLNGLTKEEKREAVLAHADTKPASTEIENL